MILRLDQIGPGLEDKVGGKALSLARLQQSGFKLPKAVCLPTGVYLDFLEQSGLKGKLFLELGRKRFADMRWEEIWDISLRIRSLFLRTPLPSALEVDLAQGLAAEFAERPVAVRSSAPGEDAARTSFAGLHDSYLNIEGGGSILEKVRLVWASLWSDRALLYRRELGLDPAKSAMAVVIQEILAGDSSGVAFSQNPLDPNQAVVEAVHGLNQGLVDGSVQPDRWIMRRQSGELLSHTPATREKAVMPVEGGVELRPLDQKLAGKAPIDQDQVHQVFTLNLKAEQLFGAPQDMEWTWGNNALHVLQSRNITSQADQDQDDSRIKYLGLTRSLENLRQLRQEINQELIPGMAEEARALAALNLAGLSDTQLAEEIERRQAIYGQWEAEYWRCCIPFAHGMRLFGQVYNDRLKPRDPYQFMRLLAGAGLISTVRNQNLQELTAMLRRDSDLKCLVEEGELPSPDHPFSRALAAFTGQYAGGAWAGEQLDMSAPQIARLALRLSRMEPAGPSQEESGVPELGNGFF
jgi:hypothetical protein